MINDLAQRTATAIPLLLACILFYWYLPPLALSITLLAVLCYIVLFEWPPLMAGNKALWLITPAYPIAPFLALIALNQNPEYHHFLLNIVALVVAYDTGAYLVGSLIGTRRLAPLISPGKTWEGCFGGYLCAVAMQFILLKFYQKHVDLMPLLLVTAAIAMVAQLGDLFESALKRRVGVKDSGSILPGHGGLLDRFDAILSVALFFYIFRSQL